MAENNYETTPFVIRTDVRRFKPFEGANHKKMQELLTGKNKEGVQVDIPRQLLSPKGLKELRLGRIGSEADKKYFRGNYVNTSLAVLPDPNSGAVKFVHRHPLIYTLTKDTKLADWNLPITQDDYESHEGFILTEGEADNLRNDSYALKTKRREFWEFAAEGDTKLTEDYTADVCKTLGLEFDNGMGLYLPRNKGLRLLCVDSVGGSGRSLADGYYYLDDIYGVGRLAGVAPEAPSARENLESKV